MELTVVIPVYDESANIGPLYARLTKVAAGVTDAYELLFVNDGSRDDTLAQILALAAKDAHVQYLDFSRNFGQQVAVMAGLDHARGAAVVIIDADLQDPPELIAELYRKFKSGYEVVYARRIKRKGETIFKRLAAGVF